MKLFALTLKPLQVWYGQSDLRFCCNEMTSCNFYFVALKKVTKQIFNQNTVKTRSTKSKLFQQSVCIVESKPILF